MKKKYLLLLATCLFTIFSTNVSACGEIKDLRVSDGTVTRMDESNYIVTVPSYISAVTISADTDYKWVENFGPRTVSTLGTHELRVDGSSCGEGIRYYNVKFNKLSNIIAENTPDETVENTPQEGNNNTDNNNNNNNGIQVPNNPDTNNPTSENTGQLILKSLSIKGYDIDFDPYKYEYEMEVDLSVSYLSIDYEKEGEDVSVSISDNAVSLKEGENLIAITLLDGNGNTSVYNIKVNKVPPKSDNNYLSSLIVDGIQLNFDPAKNVYDIQITKQLSLNIHATAQSDSASIDILGNTALHTGSVVTIKVTAEDGSVRDYVLNIEKVFNIMDYWMYIAISVLVVILIILLILMKKGKNKKNKGPKSIEGDQNTAGVVQEIESQNINTASVNQSENNGVSMNADVPVGSLKIIEPTNLDNVTDNQNNGLNSTVDEENSPTEVFKL